MMKKILFSAAVAILAVPAMASAQASQVTATAEVENYAELTGAGDLDFGTLSRTANTTINAAGGIGAALRTLSYNHNVNVSFANVPANLTANSGALTLPVSLTCSSRIGTGSWSAAGACSSASFDLNVGSALTQATLGFGGSITSAAAANAVAATYSGTFDIVVVAR